MNLRERERGKERGRAGAGEGRGKGEDSRTMESLDVWRMIIPEALGRGILGRGMERGDVIDYLTKENVVCKDAVS